jgi:hypothetical protein
MWVFDGEQWTEEGSEQKSKPEQQKQIPIGEMLPELQVLEIVQVPKTNNPVPPFPLP